MTLNRASPMTMECHGSFTDPGASALDLCSATVTITTNGSVNPNVTGAYTINYVATDLSGNSATNTRTVNVVDTTPPQKTLNGTSRKTVESHGSFTDSGETALDLCSATVTITTNGSVNPNVTGAYTLQYVATDPSGNSSTNSRTVNLVDTTPPQITLNGASPMTVECHGSFTDPGATTLDLCSTTVTIT